MTRFGYFVAFGLALSACGGSDEPFGQSGRPEADAGHDAAIDAPAPTPDAGPRIRTVEQRNAFGDLSPDPNLLVDGDFELTSASGQFGWQAIGTSAQVNLVRETGGLCRSGVTCGVITPGQNLLGLAAAPAGQAMEVSLYVKPPVADCTLTLVSLISCSSAIPSTIASVPATSDVPDASGWCRHHAIVPPTKFQPCLYVSTLADADTRTLLDQGSIVGTDASSASSLAAGAPSAELYAGVARALRILHQRIPIGAARSSGP